MMVLVAVVVVVVVVVVVAGSRGRRDGVRGDEEGGGGGVGGRRGKVAKGRGGLESWGSCWVLTRKRASEKKSGVVKMEVTRAMKNVVAVDVVVVVVVEVFAKNDVIFGSLTRDKHNPSSNAITKESL